MIIKSNSQKLNELIAKIVEGDVYRILCSPEIHAILEEYMDVDDRNRKPYLRFNGVRVLIDPYMPAMTLAYVTNDAKMVIS